MCIHRKRLSIHMVFVRIVAALFGIVSILSIGGIDSAAALAGTIDNYVAIVSLPALTTDNIVPVGNMPYWAVTSSDGNYCLVSNSKDNDVSVISYSSAQEVARVSVGSFPQRERLGAVTDEVLSSLSPTAG